MRLLIDSDVFCKLGVCGLLDPTAGVFGASAGDCARLPALPRMLRRGRLADQLGQKRCAALILLAEAMPAAPAGDEGWLSAMATVTQIDAGEAQLYAAAAVADCLVLSGDKRAMEMIRMVAGLPETLRGKIVCLEAVVIRLCEQMGVETVRARIVPALDLDAALSACFNSVDAIAGLRSYVDVLRNRLPADLLWNEGDGAMPGLWLYMPILKCKRGEKQALTLLAAEIKSHIKPLIEIVEPQGKALDAHLQTSFTGLDRALPTGTEFFLDPHEVTRTSPQVCADIYGEASARGLTFTPVIGLSSSEVELAAARDHGVQGIAVRIRRVDLDADRVGPSLTAVLARLAITPSTSDLILDMGSISHFVLPGAAALARAFIDAIPRVEEWRTLVVAGTAFPMSMRVVETNASRCIPRLEWLVWRDELKAKRTTLPRLPVFGDCGIQHPAGVERFDQRTMQASAAIRYAAGDDWLLVKGRGTRTVRPGLQFPGLAQQLTPGGQREIYFAGPQHCSGCEDISRAAMGSPGLGSPGIWRRIGTVHHITLVVEQISALPGPEAGPAR